MVTTQEGQGCARGRSPVATVLTRPAPADFMGHTHGGAVLVKANKERALPEAPGGTRWLSERLLASEPGRTPHDIGAALALPVTNIFRNGLTGREKVAIISKLSGLFWTAVRLISSVGRAPDF